MPLRLGMCYSTFCFYKKCTALNYRSKAGRFLSCPLQSHAMQVSSPESSDSLTSCKIISALTSGGLARLFL